MKLADIRDPRDVLIYARKHDYNVLELHAAENMEIPDVLKIIYLCIDKAKEKGCVEFCFKKIQYRYNIPKDANIWRVELFGFIPNKIAGAR